MIVLLEWIRCQRQRFLFNAFAMAFTSTTPRSPHGEQIGFDAIPTGSSRNCPQVEFTAGTQKGYCRHLSRKAGDKQNTRLRPCIIYQRHTAAQVSQPEGRAGGSGSIWSKQNPTLSYPPNGKQIPSNYSFVGKKISIRWCGISLSVVELQFDAKQDAALQIMPTNHEGRLV